MRDQSSGRADNLERAVGQEIATGDRADAQIDAFISRRDAQRRKSERDRAEEEAWSKFERRHGARRMAENRAAWYGLAHGQAGRHRRNLTALVAQHEAAADRLIQATDERRTA